MLTSFSNHQRSQMAPVTLRRIRQSSHTCTTDSDYITYQYDDYITYLCTLNTAKNTTNNKRAPAFTDGSRHTPQDQTVITYLYDHYITYLCRLNTAKNTTNNKGHQRSQMAPITLRRIRQSSHTCTTDNDYITYLYDHYITYHTGAW